MCATCETRPHARGLCNTCYRRAWRAGGLADHAGQLRVRASVIDQCEWFARTGETVLGAVARLGYKSENSLYAELRRAGRLDLWQRLRAA